MAISAISYRHLIRLPNVLPLLSATCLSRLAERMFAWAIVFHALAVFRSPSLAGWISFAAMAPGIAVSPLAGAFLDRGGAARGIVVDLVFSTVLVMALAVAVFLNRGSPPIMLLLVTIYALTSPLSVAGVRVLLPRLVPVRALDRANALDTAIHAIVDVVAPSLAGALMGCFGSIATFVTIAVGYAAAAIGIALVHDDTGPSQSPRNLFPEAWDGLICVIRGKLLRGLAIGYALNLVTWGILVVAVPVAIAQHFAAGAWETYSGLLWAGVGLAGGIGAIFAGHLRTLGREVTVMTACMAVTAVAIWPVAASFGVQGLVLGLVMAGLLAGAIDVGLLTLRQRRTEPGRLGRVLAVSISLNTSGFPIGTALGGMLAAWSPTSAFVAAAMASLLGALATYGLIPAEDRDP
jgi:MFS family permease